MHGLMGGGWKRGATTVDAKDPGGETPGVSAKTYCRATPPRQSSTLLRVGVSSATFSYLRHYLWQTVWNWLRRKHGSVNLIWPHDDGLIWPRESEVSRGGPGVGDRGPGRVDPTPDTQEGGTRSRKPHDSPEHHTPDPVAGRPRDDHARSANDASPWWGVRPQIGSGGLPWGHVR